MLIYLADLTHIGHGIATEAFPLNVGLIASYTLKQFGSEVDIKLFKYPDELLQAIHREAPSILGLSNYAWNSNLSYQNAMLQFDHRYHSPLLGHTPRNQCRCRFARNG